MKRSLLLLVICAWGSTVFAQPVFRFAKTKIYIVRHAEKESGNDPGLTASGKQRAGDLVRTLKNKHFSHIYVTQYRRTQMTGDSMHIQLGIDTIHYIADTTGADLIHKIEQYEDGGKVILVIGHSNTIPQIIRKLGVKNFPQENLPDNEFDNLFLVRYKNNKAYLTKMKFGKSAQTSAPMRSLQ